MYALIDYLLLIAQIPALKQTYDLPHTTPMFYPADKRNKVTKFCTQKYLEVPSYKDRKDSGNVEKIILKQVPCSCSATNLKVN